MIDIPDPPRLFALLLELDQNENLVENAVELFWQFYSNSMNMHKLEERMVTIQDSAGSSPERWSTPEMADLMLHGRRSLTELPSYD